jgi:pyruvate dehydrogenase E2 component (dihydrolipoamide acetyltransferase)
VGILAGEGEEVDINALLAETMPGSPVANPITQTAAAEKVAAPIAASPSGGQVMASPLAKRLAAEKGIDLAEISGSGPGGRITTEDIEKAITSKGTNSILGELPGRLIPLSGVRKVVAERMALSKNNPMVT